MVKKHYIWEERLRGQRFFIPEQGLHCSKMSKCSIERSADGIRLLLLNIRNNGQDSVGTFWKNRSFNLNIRFSNLFIYIYFF